MFAEPQVFTIDSIAQSLNRTGSSETGGRFGTANRTHKLEVNHQRGRRNRDQFKLTVDTLVSNPYVTGSYLGSSSSVYLVVDSPVGVDTVALKKVIDGFITNLTASSGANIVKLIGGEN